VENMLTAVIPIRHLNESTLQIKGVILEALESGLDVLLVVSNQSSDEILAIEIHFRDIVHRSFRMLCDETESPGSARNTGLAACRTTYITFWDSDDVPVVREVKALLRLLSSDQLKKYGVGSFEIVMSDTGMIIDRQILSEDKNNIALIVKNPGIWRWVFRKDALVGKKFQAFCMGEDQDFIADLDPKESEMMCSSVVTYKYIKGWTSQLTQNQKFIDEILFSIGYLAQKVKHRTSNDWHKNFLRRQILTAIKRGSWRIKFKATIFAVKVLWAYVK
jgi:glycosyltransferase involved in cell wall biosynthesis